MRASSTLPLVAGLAWCLFSSDVLAAPPGPGVLPLHVLEFYTDDADDQAKALTLAMRARVRASKDHSLADGDFALGVFLASLKCGDIPDVACQTRIGDNLKIDRYIWGTMRKVDGGQVSIDIHLWQRGQQEVRQQLSFSDNLTVAEDQSLQKIADQLLSKLVNFGKIGVVKLVNPKGLAGDLFVDGKPQGQVAGNLTELSLPIGQRQFELRSGGKVIAQGTGLVGPNNPIEIELTAVGGDNQVSFSTAEPAWKKPASYAAIGVGGAMVLGAAYMSLWSATNGFGNDSVKQVGSKLTSGTKVCDAARNPAANAGSFRGGTPDPTVLSDAASACDRGDTFKTMQTILYPVGGLLIAGGAYLLYSSSKEKGAAPAAARRFEVTPLVGQNAGYVDLKVTF
jgi:hypothetical protein